MGCKGRSVIWFLYQRWNLKKTQWYTNVVILIGRFNFRYLWPQGQTMAMMYHVVAQAIETAGLSDQYHPQDYLNFFCLGKREAALTSESSSHNQTTENRVLVCYPCCCSNYKKICCILISQICFCFKILE